MKRSRPGLTTLAVPFALGIALTLGGCASAPDDSPSTPQAVEGPTGGTLVPDVGVPKKLPDPDFSDGQEIYITADGPRPKILVAKMQVPILWVNATEAPISLASDNGLYVSGTIPVGSGFSFVSQTPVAIHYRSTLDDLEGAIQVEIEHNSPAPNP